MSIPIIEDLKNRYRTNKNNIPDEYKELFADYLHGIDQLNEKDISKGDRKYTYNCFKPALVKFLEEHGFSVFDEVNLYNPEKKVKILSNGVVKDSLSDLKKFKPKKSIDLVAVRDRGMKKIIFIEVKMIAGSNYLLPGLFELGMIDKRKIPEGYDVHFVLLSAYTNNPEKYGGLFDIYKKPFMAPEDRDRCRFVLLDPKNCFNEMKFCYEILA
jgi:hypothetical protein